MRPIQLILILSFFVMTALYFTKLRSQLLDRVLSLSLGLLSVVFVFSPELSTTLANRLGVGRGTDLLSYFFIVASVFLWMLYYTKLRKLDQMMTTLVRESALDRAMKLHEEYAIRRKTL